MSDDPIMFAEAIRPFLGAHHWFGEQCARAREAGVTWARMSVHPDNPDRFLFEGWRVQPAEPGPLRWYL